MSASPSILDSRSPLVRQLCAIRRKHVGVRLGVGLSAAAIAFIVGLSLSMGFDWRSNLSFAARGTILFAIMLLVGWLMWRLTIRSLFRTPTIERAALRAETVIGETDNRIIAALELGRRGADAGESPAMIRALVEEADALTAERDLADEVVRTEKLVAVFCTAFGLFVLVASTLFFMGPTGRALLGRSLLVPGVELPPATSVEMATPAPLRVARGEDLELRFRASGVIPSAGVLHLRRAGRDGTAEVDLKPIDNEPGVFGVTLRRIGENSSIVASLGDGHTPSIPIEAVDRPQTAGVTFIELPPAYTRRPPLDHKPADLTLLTGSRLGATIVTSKPVAAQGCVLILHGPETTVPLTRDSNDPRKLHVDGAGAEIGADVTGVSVRLVDEYGFDSRGEASYPISLEPDAAPTVTLVKPNRTTLLLTPWAQPVLAIDAKDDIGVSRVRVRFAIQHSSHQEMPPGTGLIETDFDSDDFSGTTATRLAPAIDVDWGMGSAAPNFRKDKFTVRWTGQLFLPEETSVQFRIEADDRARLWIDEGVLVDTFLDDDEMRIESKSRKLAPGLHSIRIDFREDTGAARCRLLWRMNGRGNWMVVPTANLYPSADAAKQAADSAVRYEEVWAVPDGPAQPNVTTRWTWNLVPLQLVPGDAVSWQAEAIDGNDVTGPGIAQTAGQVIRIGTADEVRNAALQQLDETMQQIVDLEQQQNQLANEVGRILGQFIRR